MHHLAKIFALSVATTVGVEYLVWKTYFQAEVRASKGWPRSVLPPTRRDPEAEKGTQPGATVVAERSDFTCSQEHDVVPEKAPEPTDTEGPQSGPPCPPDWREELASLVSIADNWEDEVDDEGNFYPIEGQSCAPQAIPVAGEDESTPDAQPAPQLARHHHMPSLNFIAEEDEEDDEPEPDETISNLSRQCVTSAEDAHEQTFIVPQVSEKFVAGTEHEEIDEAQLDPVDLAIHRRLLIAHNTGLANTWAVADVYIESFEHTIDRQKYAPLYDPQSLDHSEWPLPADATPEAEISQAGEPPSHAASWPRETGTRSSLSLRRHNVTSAQELWADFEVHVAENNMTHEDIHEWKVPPEPQNLQRITRVAFGRDTVKFVDPRPCPRSGADDVDSYPDETHAQEKYDAWTWKLYGNTERPFQVDETTEEGMDGVGQSGDPRLWSEENSKCNGSSDKTEEDNAADEEQIPLTKGLPRTSAAALEFVPTKKQFRPNPSVHEFVPGRCTPIQ